MKGLRERFVRVYNPVATFPFDLRQTVYAGYPPAGSINTEFSNEFSQQPETVPPRSSRSDMALSMTSSLELGTSSGAKNNPDMQSRFPAAGEDEILSGNDWYTLPFDGSANGGVENTFMQSFFEIDSADTRFFWDNSL